MKPTRRIEQANGHRYLLDGTPATGVTTILGKGVPKPALVPWAAKACGNYAIDNWDTLAELTLSQRLAKIVAAPTDDRDTNARRGTEVHRLAARIITGEEIPVPDELVGHVDSYIKFLDAWQVEPVLLETTIINRTYQYMGTFDLAAHLNNQTWLLDIKTTRSGVFPETALQLAAYRYAETFLDDHDHEQPMLEVDRCGAIWVRADGYDLYPIQAGPDEHRTFLYAQQIAHFADTGRHLIGDALYAS